MTQRSSFLDHIRLVLTCLVILHHAAITYGAPGAWYVAWPAADPAAKLALTAFVAVNQAFFMGFFFLMAGYFSVPSYERKGPLAFLRDRLVRLGIPTLVFGFVLGPMTVALAQTAQGKPFLANWLSLMRAGYFNIGPLWFAWALLLLSAGFVLWRAVLRGSRGASEGCTPRHGHLLAAALLTGAVAFALRLWVPVGQARWEIQVGYCASYVALFAAGCALARGRWLERIDAATARPWLVATVVCGPLLMVYVAVGGPGFHPEGGWTLPALAYAFWEPFVAWGIILTMLWRFRVRAERPGARAGWSAWAGGAYGAYIVHPPVLVASSLLLAQTALAAPLRLAIAGVAGITVSFVLGRLLLRVPGARRVL